jgi:hypothetical protein
MMRFHSLTILKLKLSAVEDNLSSKHTEMPPITIQSKDSQRQLSLELKILSSEDTGKILTPNGP